MQEQWGSAMVAFEHHQFKGDKERVLNKLRRDLGLHYPPCLELRAHQVFYTPVVLGYDILTALRLTELPEQTQGWRLCGVG